MQSLTTTIRVRDADGRMTDKEVATYAGLLSRAHDEGLKSVVTELIQIPTGENALVAIAKAEVVTEKGVFTGIGDASPENVTRKIVPHIIRMAETRAKARAFRDAVNIGMVCLEELGGDEGDVPGVVPDERPRHTRDDNVRELNRDSGERRREGGRGRDATTGTGNQMTDNQRRFLYRLLSEEGFEGARATDELLHRAEVGRVSDITKELASRLIDEWKGSGHAA